MQTEKVSVKNIKKEKEDPPATSVVSKRGRPTAAATAAALAACEEKPDKKHEKEEKEEKKSRTSASSKATSAAATKSAVASSAKAGPASAAKAAATTSKAGPSTSKKPAVAAEVKTVFKKDKDEDELKGLEEMYYAVRDGIDMNFESFPYKTDTGNETEAIVADTASSVDCPICDITECFDSNEKLQTHLVSHISLDGKDHQFQCLFCLDKHASESVLSKHNQFQHPTETKASTSASYHCLICQQRFNSLHFLTTHLYKHNMLELPYVCQACGYRSSSHRDVVRHFYDDHKNQNFLQCPFCLDVSKFVLQIVNIKIINNPFCFSFRYSASLTRAKLM